MTRQALAPRWLLVAMLQVVSVMHDLALESISHSLKDSAAVAHFAKNKMPLG
jgi:hypothetical protein